MPANRLPVLRQARRLRAPLRGDWDYSSILQGRKSRGIATASEDRFCTLFTACAVFTILQLNTMYILLQLLSIYNP